MKWYEIKEQAAGTKRLFLLWYIYKILGKTPVKIITFFVTLIACINAKQVRECSKKYLEIVGEKPSFKNVFRHFLSYSYSLVDRMEIFTNNFPPEKLYFEDEEQKKLFLEDLKNFKGTFFICNHLGNVDAMRSFVNSDIKDTCSSVSVFLAKEQCKIFSGFIEKITTNKNINLYPVEEIDINTSIEIKEKLNKGGIVFMAGDRISAQSNNFETEFLNHKVLFPIGTFKFAQMMEVPVYFVSAIKMPKDRYCIHLKRFYNSQTKAMTLTKMQKEFVAFLEEKTKLAPYQFYHFYNFFNE